MKITVQQGCNLSSTSTSVTIEAEKIETKLIDRFKDLHPVFMKSYSINGTVVTIQTNIPHLWKNSEFAKHLELCALGNETYEQAENAMMEYARLILGSMTTIPLLDAAHNLGYETLQLYVNEGTLTKKGWNLDYSIGIGAEQQLIHSASSSGDAAFAQKTQKTKILTNQFLEEMGLPLAAWSPVASREDLPAIADKLGFPLVMKPVGLTGGHGVQIGMKTIKELEDAWDRIHYYYEHEMKFPELKSAWQKEILVQRVLKGNDYRILLIDGKFEIATHRQQARVIGDGKSTIEQLIQKENTNPARDIRLPIHTLKPIVIDEDLKKVLEKQDLSLEQVPAEGAYVRVRDVASMSQGGITEDVTEKVCPQIRYLAETIASSIHAHVLGLDILCVDITKPLTLENGGIIEMNTMPEMYLNTFPVVGKQYPEVHEKMITSLMGNTPRTHRIVILGSINEDTIRETIAQALPEHGRIGSLHKGTYSIEGEVIQTGLSTHEGVLCLKKNASLNTIVLHYDTIEEVSENGFGFNTIDLFITNDPNKEKIANTISQLQNENLIHKLITIPS